MESQRESSIVKIMRKKQQIKEQTEKRDRWAGYDDKQARDRVTER